MRTRPAVFPDHTAIIHGALRRSYAEFYARARRLASALAKRGIKRGDTVSALLANTPAMLECHYGVPMTGGVLNTLNTRLDAAKMEWMLRALSQTDCPMSCPHGRPIALHYSTREILKAFHRI